jgi:DNA-binding response OmpR family regulator
MEDLIVVLVVEDDQSIQIVVEEALADGGFGVAIASTGEEAVKLLDATSSVYRALVTDIGLGGGKMDGWALARQARENIPDLPVVYMSGESAQDWAAQGVPNSLMLAKPFAPAQLVTAVSQLLNRGTP